MLLRSKKMWGFSYGAFLVIIRVKESFFFVSREVSFYKSGCIVRTLPLIFLLFFCWRKVCSLNVWPNIIVNHIRTYIQIVSWADASEKWIFLEVSKNERESGSMHPVFFNASSVSRTNFNSPQESAKFDGSKKKYYALMAKLLLIVCIIF